MSDERKQLRFFVVESPMGRPWSSTGRVFNAYYDDDKTPMCIGATTRESLLKEISALYPNSVEVPQ